MNEFCNKSQVFYLENPENEGTVKNLSQREYHSDSLTLNFIHIHCTAALLDSHSNLVNHSILFVL